MLTQIEMAQSVYDNGGTCGAWSCDDCVVRSACYGYVATHGPDFEVPVDEACLLAAEEFLSNNKPPAKSYLTNKTRKKPAFARSNGRILTNLRSRRV